MLCREETRWQVRLGSFCSHSCLWCYLVGSRAAKLGQQDPDRQPEWRPEWWSSLFDPSYFLYLWGYSSVGRAAALQAVGHRFDSDYLHHIIFGTIIFKISSSYASITGSQGVNLLDEVWRCRGSELLIAFVASAVVRIWQDYRNRALCLDYHDHLLVCLCVLSHDQRLASLFISVISAGMDLSVVTRVVSTRVGGGRPN